ncbi:MAG: hypothetical protein A3B78_00645 [Omnitrophica WOR_2 bacterium RIFCSPHIGHO2_02_FULL_67_20]|nr:MAG: hypothetical protein A3B78_00645 [Omnitrophica WOR_2 bacterium RIFCSPHIGHO2_02_FULL_67_20]
MTQSFNAAIGLRKTALYERHRALGAKMTDFHGWEMPLYYTSILEEHKAVREALGVFDISHMGQVLVTGPDALEQLNGVVVSDLAQVGEGRACYTLLLNERGGILDDLIIYRLGESDLLVIVNCANRASDTEWLRSHCRGSVTVTDISDGRAILAVQGPRASRVLEQILDARVAGLGRFGVAPIRTMGTDACLARTGYTGGDGFELFLPDQHARKLWDLILLQAKPLGALPVGLGARDTLRVEAGLRLYGGDMDEATTPLEAGLAWTVALHKRRFIGKDALLKQQETGVTRKFVGFELSQGPVPRQGAELLADAGGARPGQPDVGGRAGGALLRRVGTVTSGTFSPILSRPLGMGYVEPAFAKPGTALTLTVRAQRYAATVVKLPFWKGESQQAVMKRPGGQVAERRSSAT